jgi:hypothetical protein
MSRLTDPEEPQTEEHNPDYTEEHNPDYTEELGDDLPGATSHPTS